MDKNTLLRILNELIEEHQLDVYNCLIEPLPEDPYDEDIIMSIEGPNFYEFTITIQLSDDAQSEQDIKLDIMNQIRMTVQDFDVDEIFDQYYHVNSQPFPPSIFVDNLREDKAFFDSI